MLKKTRSTDDACMDFPMFARQLLARFWRIGLTHSWRFGLYESMCVNIKNFKEIIYLRPVNDVNKLTQFILLLTAPLWGSNVSSDNIVCQWAVAPRFGQMRALKGVVIRAAG
jgi:hypothetical protein